MSIACVSCECCEVWLNAVVIHIVDDRFWLASPMTLEWSWQTTLNIVVLHECFTLFCCEHTSASLKSQQLMVELAFTFTQQPNSISALLPRAADKSNSFFSYLLLFFRNAAKLTCLLTSQPLPSSKHRYIYVSSYNIIPNFNDLLFLRAMEIS